MDKKSVSFRQLIPVFLKIGAIGFGGGMAMLALIRQHIVQKKKWITDDELSVGVAMGQMLPGPFVPNYVEFIGFRLRGVKGALISVGAFLFPSVAAMVLLSFLYFQFQTIPGLQYVFKGIGPVVTALILWATLEMGRASIKDWRQILIAIIAFVGLFFKFDVLLTILACGILGILFYRKIPAAPLFALLPIFKIGWLKFVKGLDLAYIFLKIGAIIFGGGFAAIPFIKNEVVEARHWLTAKEFIDGVALGQITPGPVAITATFVGYKVLGIPGAIIATIAIFLPSFLMLWGLLKIYERIKSHPLVISFLKGVKPAIVGMLLSAAVFIGRTAIHDIKSVVVGVVALGLLILFRLDPIWLIIGGGILGIILK